MSYPGAQALQDVLAAVRSQSKIEIFRVLFMPFMMESPRRKTDESFYLMGATLSMPGGTLDGMRSELLEWASDKGADVNIVSDRTVKRTINSYGRRGEE